VGSLNVHQSKSNDHDRLGFHPDCPTCRQDRLFGVLAPVPDFSRRLRVLLATGVLALSAGATSTSIASEPDHQEEGVLAPDQTTPPDSTPSVPSPPTSGGRDTETGRPGDALGPGAGSETVLPPEVGAGLGAPESDWPEEDGAPLETEPSQDPDLLLQVTDPAAPETLNSDDVPAPPTEPVPPDQPTTPADPPADEPGQAETTEKPPGAKRERKGRGERTLGGRSKRRGVGRNRRNQGGQRNASGDTRPQPPSNGLPAGAPDLAPSASESPAAAATPAAAPAAAPPAGIGRFHVVKPGESLWSIATGLLGPDASAVAVALEVRRLWKLNEERIDTGDPNLLRVGVKLRLR
jgi:hypothetical protein